MIRQRLSLVFVLLLGSIALLPAGVLAATPGGAISVVDDGSRHAIAVTEWQGAAAATASLTLKASGLTPGKRYRMVGSAATCGAPNPRAKHVFSVSFTASGRGAAWLSARSVGRLAKGWAAMRSTRLMEDEGIFYYFCTPAARFRDAAPASAANAAISIVDSGARHGIVIIDGATATTVRIRHDIQVGSDSDPRLAVRSTSCSKPATAQSVLVSAALPVRGHGQTFGQRTETVDKDESISVGGQRSARVRDAGSGAWDCAAPRRIEVENDETH